MVFVHMRKHAGTSIRRMFQSQGTWQLLRIVCHGGMQSNGHEQLDLDSTYVS